MRIAIVNHIYLETELSGTTQREVVRALNELGHPTDLIVPSLRVQPRRRVGPGTTGHLHRLRTWSRHPAVSLPMFNVKVARRLRAMIRTDRPDVVVIDHCAVGGALPYILLGRALRRLPRFVLDVRSQPVESTGVVGRLRVLEYLVALALGARLLPGVTFLTEGMGREELRRVGSSREYGVWGSGVDPARFAPERWLDSAQRLRKELGVDDRFVVLYHGDVSPNRGLDLAVEAFALLSRRCLQPAPLLAVLGDGVAQASLEQLAATLEAPVRFLGRVPHEDVPAYVVMSDVALMALPDHKDWRYQFPLKFAECMASGTPTIVSPIPAFTELAGSSPAVVYVREVTPEAIAEKVEHCIEHHDRLVAWGAEGRARAEEYSWRRVAERLVSYLAGT